VEPDGTDPTQQQPTVAKTPDVVSPSSAAVSVKLVSASALVGQVVADASKLPVACPALQLLTSDQCSGAQAIDSSSPKVSPLFCLDRSSGGLVPLVLSYSELDTACQTLTNFAKQNLPSSCGGGLPKTESYFGCLDSLAATPKDMAVHFCVAGSNNAGGWSFLSFDEMATHCSTPQNSCPNC